MANERVSMRNAKEVLRQKYELGRSHREIATSIGRSAGTVGALLARARAAGLVDWQLVSVLDEEALGKKLYGTRDAEEASGRAEPDCEWIMRERCKPGVTMQLLHLEYLQKHSDGYQYTAFCSRYRAWRKSHEVTMRQQHVAGDKMFVDYSGDRLRVVDATTGEVKEVELFVAILGASNLTYAEATWSQKGPDWIGSHVRAYAYFGGVPKATVCDQLKSGVTKACRYEPEIQRGYEEMALHYGTTILPARPKSPRDKAKVESAVLHMQRWVIAALRNEVFSTLQRLNERILELVNEWNQRTMKAYGKSRRELFEELERAALMPLPTEAFEYASWSKARVSIDYHIAVEGHFYSVPHALVYAQVEVRKTPEIVEIFSQGKRVASHVKSPLPGRHTTLDEHMPKAHRAHAEWTPQRIISWAETVGPGATRLCETILTTRRHPEHGYRSCLGLYRLCKRFGPERFEAACLRVMCVGGRSYRNVECVLRRGLDKTELVQGEPEPLAIAHENVRGGHYYQH